MSDPVSDSVKDGVNNLNHKIGGKKKPKDLAKGLKEGATAVKKPAPLPTEGYDLKVKVRNGKPQLPAEWFRIEVGVYDNQKEKENGFCQLGICRVILGIPTPDGGFFPVGFMDHKLEKLGSKLRLIGPLSVSKKSPTEDGPAEGLFATAGLYFREQIVRTAALILKKGLCRTCAEMWAETRPYQPVWTYDTDPGKTGTMVPLLGE